MDRFRYCPVLCCFFRYNISLEDWVKKCLLKQDSHKPCMFPSFLLKGSLDYYSFIFCLILPQYVVYIHNVISSKLIIQTCDILDTQKCSICHNLFLFSFFVGFVVTKAPLSLKHVKLKKKGKVHSYNKRAKLRLIFVIFVHQNASIEGKQFELFGCTCLELLGQMVNTEQSYLIRKYWGSAQRKYFQGNTGTPSIWIENYLEFKGTALQLSLIHI